MSERVERVLGQAVQAVEEGPDAGGDAAGWAVGEFGAVALGDPRLRARLVQLATQAGAQPSASLPQACGDTPGALKATYRFFDNPAVDGQAVLASHIAATYRRVGATEVVLAVQDTTYLDYSRHKATTGLGPLRSAAQQGLLVHSTLAITPERVPLGLLAQQVWARDLATYAPGDPDAHKARPITEKESQKWLTSLAAVGVARQACPTTHFVSVGDREADVYELFVAPRPAGVDLLVRACWDRAVTAATPATPERKLWAAAEAGPVGATATLHVPARPARPAGAGQPARPVQPARTATLALRFRQVTLRPPRRQAGATSELPLTPVVVWVVLAREEALPAGAAGAAAGVEPVEWLLLTTCPVQDAAAALERLAWYACRWGIEVWHKVLKSGCQLEAKQLGTAARLERCLVLYSVVAWRVLYAILLARALPDAPCTALLTATEWQALYCILHQTVTPPSTSPSLRDAVRAIAHLGGFLGRAHDGEPGPTVLWRGLQRLHDFTAMYRLMTLAPQSTTCG